MQVLTYLFWPNPGIASYADPAFLGLLLFCAALIIGGIAFRWLRLRMDPVTRKLTRSWSALCIVFGCIGCILVVSRVEGVQYFSMRFLWLVWGAAFIAVLGLQWKLFRTQHYRVLHMPKEDSLREKYLPRSRRRRSS